MNRRGFSLTEMSIVLSIIGILAGIAAPRVQDSVDRGRAAALAERVAGVRLAYEAVDEPSAEALRAPVGTVPQGLAAALADGFFRGEGGVELAIAGSGNSVFLMIRSNDLTGRRVRDAYNRIARTPHLHTERVTMVPLSPVAMRATATPVLLPVAVPQPQQPQAQPQPMQPQPTTGTTTPTLVPPLQARPGESSVPVPTGGTPNPSKTASTGPMIPPPLRDTTQTPNQRPNPGSGRVNDPAFTTGTPEYARRVEEENAAVRAAMARYDSVQRAADRAAQELARVQAAAQSQRNPSTDPAFTPGTLEYARRVEAEREAVRLAGLRYDSLHRAAERAALAVELREQQAGIAPRCSPTLPPDVFRECASYGDIGWFRK